MQPLLQWKSNEYYTNCVPICSLRHPACNAHAPYYHLWPAPLYSIFPHYLINRRFSEKKVLNTWRLFRVSLQFLFEMFFILGTAVAQRLTCCAANRKVAVSIPAGVIGIFHRHKILPIALWPWGRPASNRNEYQEHFLGVKAAGA